MRQLIPLIRANERKVAWVFLAMILTQYGTSLVYELDDEEPYEDYKMYLIPFYERCTLDRFEHFWPNGVDGEPAPYRNFLKSWLNCFGHQVFGNDRILPALFSIGCVYLVYLLGHSMTNDRIIGLISAIALMLNPLLTIFDTSPTYDQAWAFFFLLSMVLLFRKPKLSPLVYPLAIFSKIYAIAFLAAYLITAYRNKKDFKLVLVGTGLLIMLGVAGVSILGFGNTFGFFPERLEEAGLRIFEVLWLVLPAFMLLFGLDMIFKGHYPQNRNIVLMWMFWIMLTIPLVYLFSQQFMFGYRFVPFAAFMSIYAGMVAVKLGNMLVSAKMRKGTKIENQS